MVLALPGPSLSLRPRRRRQKSGTGIRGAGLPRGVQPERLEEWDEPAESGRSPQEQREIRAGLRDVVDPAAKLLLQLPQDEPAGEGGGAMSVIVVVQVAGDAKAAEQWASDNPAKMQGVLEAAKRHGLIAHRFYGSGDGGSVMVLDEWPDRQSFESFFQEQASEIGPMFEAVTGVTQQMEPTFWRELATHDAYGWGA